MSRRVSDDELKRFLLEDLRAENPELEGVDLVPQLRAAIGGGARRPRLPASEGKGTPRLFLELYWGDRRQQARSFAQIPPSRPVVGALDDRAAMPLWGFELEGPMRLADQRSSGYRVFIPPGAQLELSGKDRQFHPVTSDDGYVKLGNGEAVRFFVGDTSLVAYVQPPLPRPWINPLKQLPYLSLGLMVVLTAAFWALVGFGPDDERPDFVPKNLSPVAVRLIAPEPKKKEEAKRKLEAIKKKAPVKKQPVALAVSRPTALAKPPRIKALEKLTAAGPAMRDLLASVDKLGGGPGKKNAKNKLSDLIGKGAQSTAGLGSFGIGGGGAGGQGTRGLETLRGKGGGGIGAMGAGNIGKGAVGGTVARAMSRSLAASGSIDREAVARVINSHLGEVSSCYERALLREPALSGKIVLEWNISTSGVVTTAKTKSSTMKSSAVEGCILTALKKWKFPPARGSGVVISYPFLFNSVGY